MASSAPVQAVAQGPGFYVATVNRFGLFELFLCPDEKIPGRKLLRGLRVAWSICRTTR